MTRALLVACCLGIASCWSGLAHAGQGPVIVVTADQHAELGRRLTAEARQAGMRVVDAPSASDAADVLRSNGAVATLRVVSATAIEVVIHTDRGKPISETWYRRPGEGDSFPLRVIEEVRARLVDLELWPAESGAPSVVEPEAATNASAAEPPPAASAQPEQRAIQAPPPARSSEVDSGNPSGPPGAHAAGFWVVGGAGVAVPDGGIGTTPHAWLGARFDWSSPLGAELVALVPLTESEVSEPEGEADVSATACLGHLDYALRIGSSARLRAGAGGGVLVLKLRGEAEPGFVASDDTLVSGLGYAELGAAFGLGSWMRLSATTLLGMSAPRPVLRFDEHEVAAWGRWFVAASLRAELRLGLGEQP